MNKRIKKKIKKREDLRKEFEKAYIAQWYKWMTELCISKAQQSVFG